MQIKDYLGVITYIVLVAVLWGLASCKAGAHEWYDGMCCSDKDCHPIASCSELTENADGSISWGNYTFAKERIKPSQDSQCHVCIYDSPGMFNTTGSHQVPMCVYIQQNS